MPRILIEGENYRIEAFLDAKHIPLLFEALAAAQHSRPDSVGIKRQAKPGRAGQEKSLPYYPSQPTG